MTKTQDFVIELKKIDNYYKKKKEGLFRLLISIFFSFFSV